jgi:predicted DNA-binding transcriptional regulator AlpA
MFGISDDRLLKANDIARVLGISRASAYRLMVKDLPSIRFSGGTVRVQPHDLEIFIQSHRQQATSEGETSTDQLSLLTQV